MIIEPRNVTCARCRGVSTQGTEHRRTPQTAPRDVGLDGRTAEEASPVLDRCPHCGWLDVRIALAHEGFAQHDVIQRRLADEGHHGELARRYMGLGWLRGRADPGAVALWLLRAAWADDDAGHAVGAQVLRLRAGRLLEGLLAQGHTLSPVAGHSSLILTELFRVGGDADRAALHLRRGILAARDLHTKRMFAFEAWCMGESDRAPHVVGDAEDAMRDPARLEAARRVAAAMPSPPPIVILPAVDPPFLPFELHVDRRAVFARDFLRTEEDLVTFCRAGMAVWPAVEVRPALLDALCRAVDHPDETVRARALQAFDAVTVPKEPVSDEGVAALLARLEDEAFRAVRDAGSVLAQIVWREERHRTRVLDVVRRVLPRWKRDPPTEGNLERIVAAIEDARRREAPATAAIETAAAAPAPRTVIDLACIHMWTEWLCVFKARTAVAAAAELGVEGALVKEGSGVAIVEPPPDGAARFAIALTRDGDAVDRIEIDLVGGFTRAQLDHELGFGVDRPRTGPDAPVWRAYARSTPGLLQQCEVRARFDTDPEPGTITKSLRLAILRFQPSDFVPRAVPAPVEAEKVSLERLLAAPLVFSATRDGEVPYLAVWLGRTLTIRINDFPAEPLYSVLVDGDELGDLDDWPTGWTKPDPHVGGRDN